MTAHCDWKPTPHSDWKHLNPAVHPKGDVRGPRGTVCYVFYDPATELYGVDRDNAPFMMNTYASADRATLLAAATDTPRDRVVAIGDTRPTGGGAPLARVHVASTTRVPRRTVWVTWASVLQKYLTSNHMW